MGLIINICSINKMMVIMLIFLVMLSDGCLEQERIALLQLKASFTSIDETTLFYWGSDPDCCKWDGVKCDDNTLHVIKIECWEDAYISEYGGYWEYGHEASPKKYGVSPTISQYLNVSIFLPFHRLQILNITNMGIVGCVHDEGFEKLSILKNLEILDLSFNYLNNSQLLSIGRISSLKILRLERIGLKGSIDMEELNTLNKLEELDLSDNKITELVASKGMRNLERLLLQEIAHSERNFRIRFPWKFPSIKFIDLSMNNFKGAIFDEDIHNSTNVEYINLDWSSMDEKAVHSLGALSSLRSLSMTGFIQNSSTQEGSLPFLPNLRHLDLRGSFINSRFLKDIGKMTNLEFMDVGFCNLNSAIPIGSLPFLPNLRHLDLSGNSINSRFLKDIGKMTNLEYMDLSDCNLNSAIPIGICKLNHLQNLQMDRNNLNGILPSCIGNLTSLKTLSLSGNNLVDNLPSSITNLTLLESLDISANLLSFDISLQPFRSLSSLISLNLDSNFIQIPCSLNPFLNHSRLESLRFSDNEMYVDTESHNISARFQLHTLYILSRKGNCKEFPKILFNQQNLEYVALSSFKIKSEFPCWLLDNNPNLTHLTLSNVSLFGQLQLPKHPHMRLLLLDLSNNFLNNNMPADFGAYFPSLNSLSLCRNEFTGIIPFSVSQMSDELQRLDLSNNYLNGNIPTWINNMSLVFLNLKNNCIYGTIPPFTSRFLKHIHLSRNQLHGTIDDKLKNSTGSLKTIDVGYNYFTGIIPNLTMFDTLEYILLSHNNLEGEIPINLCELPLSLIDFSYNNLFGNIPSCLRVKGQWGISYTYHHLEPMEFTSKSFSYLYQERSLQTMSGIDLSCNNLIENIPLDIGNLDQMQVLNLSHNRLIGPIPWTFSNLKNIESLDLSYNNLSGSIPYEIKNLYFLEVFNVTYNNLSGKIPDRVNQFATFDKDSYVGNPFLCGEPLNKSCKIEGETPLLNSSKERNEPGFMDMGSFSITFSVTYIIVLLGIVVVLFINPYWRRVWFYFIEMNMTKCYYFFS